MAVSWKEGRREGGGEGEEGTREGGERYVWGWGKWCVGGSYCPMPCMCSSSVLCVLPLTTVLLIVQCDPSCCIHIALLTYAVCVPFPVPSVVLLCLPMIL